MRDLIKRIVRESTQEMKEARRYPTYEMNEDSFARVFEFFLNELKNNTGFSHAKMRKSLILTIRMWTEKPPQLISKTVLDHFIDNHPNINPYKVSFRPRGKFGIDVIFEHTTPVNLFVVNLFKSKNIEDIKRVMSEYSGMSIITREEDLCLHSKGFSKNRPQGWELAYAECDIEVMTEDEFNIYKNQKQSQFGDRDFYLNEDKALYTVEELRQLALKYQNFKDFKKNEPKALAAIRRKGKDFENELTSHMDRSHYKKWTEDELRSEALKYSTRTDFQNQSPNADAAARARGKQFFDDITSHMILKKRDKFSDEDLEREAQKYKTKIDFQKNSPSEYQTAQRRGKDFYDKITQHMENQLTYWDISKIKEVISKYETIKDLRTENPSAYSWLLSLKKKNPQSWEDLTKNLVRKHRTWTDQDLENEAKKYTKLSDFWKYSSSAAQTSKDRGKDFYNQITKHLEKITQWTDDMLKDEAKKYNTLPEFKKNSPNAVQAAYKRGILQDITMHMEKTGSRFQRLIYAYEFPDKSVYVGLTYNLNKRDRSHMNSPTSAVNIHIQNTGLRPIRKSLTEFMTKEEASKMEGRLKDKYESEGWTILNKAKTGALGGDVLKWSEDAIRQEALKYDTLSDFYKYSASALNRAKMLGKDFYKDITSHMSSKIRYLTDDEVSQIAKKFKTKKEFLIGDRRAYNIARRRGKEFFDKVTSHMSPMRKKWDEDSIRQEALKFQSKKEFANKSGSAYNLARSKGLDFFNSVTKHMGDKRR